MKTTEFNEELWKFNNPFGVPSFGEISIEDYRIGYQIGIAQYRADIDAIVNNPDEPTFENTFLALDNAGDLLSRVSAVFGNDKSLNSSEELRKLAAEITPTLSKLGNEVLFNAKLFQRLSNLHQKKDTLGLTEEELFLLENRYQSYVANGANLDHDEQEKLKVIKEKISPLILKFNNNVLAETNKYRLVIENEEDLAGLPQDIIDAAAQEAAEAEMPGKWIFSMHFPSYGPFMKFSENRQLREQLHKMFVNRANNNDEFDNKEIFAEIIKLRAQKAQLLGHASHSEFILQRRMAKKPEKVMELLNKIGDLSLPVAQKNINDLQEYLHREDPNLTLEPWDRGYISEKIRKEKYSIDSNEVKQYFQLEKVRDGMFVVAKKLYGITFKEVDIPTPHPTATTYQVQETDGTHIGILYLDLFPRKSKQSGAWFNTYHEGCDANGLGKHTIGIISCNFPKPTKDTPALLDLSNVKTLFHEFGHSLDFLLSKSQYNSSYIAWDFVELASQIMEHWATEKEVLNMYANHWETGEVLPEELLQKLKDASHFNNGLAAITQVSYGLLDMSYHTLQDASQLNVSKHEAELFQSIGLTGALNSGNITTRFSHIIGGYDSGYYGYLWAKVLDNDAYQVFKEKGIFDQETANRFRKCILEPNGVKDAMEMFVDFRGREPEIEPMLKHLGLI